MALDSPGRSDVRPNGDDGRERSGPLLHCSNITKKFAYRTAVDDVTFQLSRGEIYGLLGPNGAGKTTAIKMVCGLLTPDSGSISLDGHSPFDSLETKSKVGYVPQDVALYPDLTARENLTFLGRLYRLSGRLLEE